MVKTRKAREAFQAVWDYGEARIAVRDADNKPLGTALVQFGEGPCGLLYDFSDKMGEVFHGVADYAEALAKRLGLPY